MQQEWHSCETAIGSPCSDAKEEIAMWIHTFKAHLLRFFASTISSGRIEFILEEVFYFFGSPRDLFDSETFFGVIITISFDG